MLMMMMMMMMTTMMVMVVAMMMMMMMMTITAGAGAAGKARGGRVAGGEDRTPQQGSRHEKTPAGDPTLRMISKSDHASNS
jgi:hypothetical protein